MPSGSSKACNERLTAQPKSGSSATDFSFLRTLDDAHVLNVEPLLSLRIATEVAERAAGIHDGEHRSRFEVVPLADVVRALPLRVVRPLARIRGEAPLRIGSDVRRHGSQRRAPLLGGYTERKQGFDIQDVSIVERLRNEKSVAELPLFGCAVSRSLQALLDPLGIKYRAEPNP